MGKVVLWWTSTPSTVKVKKDTLYLRQLLTVKRVIWEEVDIALDWEARQLLRKEEVQTLPQVQVDGKYIGTIEILQDLEDHGELNKHLDLLRAGGHPLLPLFTLATQPSKALGKDGCMRAAEMLREAAWEKLYTGHWKDVAVAWRDLYSLATLLTRSDHQQQQQQQQQQRKRQRLQEGQPGLSQHGQASCGKQLPVPEGADDDAAAAAAQRPAQPVQLPQGSLCGRGIMIPRTHVPSLEHFLADYMQHGQHGSPLVLTGCMEEWPARVRWRNLDYLREAAGSRTVPVEVGQHYLAEGWGQSLMTLATFIDTHLQQPSSPAAGGSLGYLAQHALFDQIPALAADIRQPEYCCLGEDDTPMVNAWFGPAGTVTPLHTDPHHNLLCQVVGSKYLRLYSAEDTEHLSPFSQGLTTNSSQIDLEKIQDAESVAHLSCWECQLQAGEMLYIPPKWMHYVKALSTSFSVSFWWQ
ncbi:hypothetical protein WJX73_008268 [Symbiochloris irregularis]|uniref:JmjC domain-containing protein n=1 Tax=Symbiochloris irregularis TaxID=706552 RepID=A0AAW1PA86_9CHLO